VRLGRFVIENLPMGFLMIAMGVSSAIEKAVIGGSGNRIFFAVNDASTGTQLRLFDLALPLADTKSESRRSVTTGTPNG
jgi:hypothetical protein